MALDASAGLRRASELASYVYFHSTRAELLARCGRRHAAGMEFERARACSENGAERDHLFDRAGMVSCS